jgi:hypothetical protein
MAALGIRKTTWQSTTVRNRAILRAIGAALNLGEPAEYRAPGGALWFVFDDHRFKLIEVAYFGCLIANLTDIPPGYTIPLDDDGLVDRDQIRADAKTFCDNQGVVKPADVTLGDNPWQDILDAQNTPAAVQMASGVPTSWTPVGGE